MPEITWRFNSQAGSKKYDWSK